MVTVSKIVFGFPNSAIADIEMADVDLDEVWSAEGGPNIEQGQTKTWLNGILYFPDGSQHSNVVYHDAPAPPTLEIRIYCENFSSPLSITRGLVPHWNDNGDGYYSWPLPGTASKTKPFPKYFYVAGSVHGNGPGGTQMYAHDIGEERYIPGKWVETKVHGSPSENQGYLIWGRDILAMANGVVESVYDGMNDNTVLGQVPIPTPDPGAGNHVVVRHGNELVTYAHMRKGSIPGWIYAGKKVDRGETLGKAGNSGNSTNPHLHIHVLSLEGYLRPIVFRGLRACTPGLVSPPLETSQWVEVDFAGLSQSRSAIYRYSPSRPPPLHAPRRKKKTRFAKPHVPHSRKKKKTTRKKKARAKKK